MKKITNFKLFGTISESIDKEIALKNENAFFTTVTSISLIIGSIASFLVLYLVLNVDLIRVLVSSSILLLLGLLFILFSKLKNEVLKMYIFSVITSSVVIFSYFAYYKFIGPAVFSIAFLMMMLIMIYSRIEILLVFLITNICINLLAWYDNVAFIGWSGFHPSHVSIVMTMSLVAISLFKVIEMRQKKIIEQYNAIMLSEEMLYSTLIAVGDGVISVDEKGFIEYMNPTASNLIGWDNEKAKGQRFEVVFRIISSQSKSLIISPIQEVFETNDKIETDDYVVLVSADGSETPISCSSSPIKDKNKNIVGVVVVFKDISDMVKKQEETERTSHTDYLTQVFNRRYFEQELIRLDQEHFLPMSIIFVDINGLKIINDAFGHEYGDELIQEVAKALKLGCRGDDIMARTGGDEFVLLLPNTTVIEAKEIIDRVKQHLENKKILELDITFSFGVATKESPSDDIMKVMKKAEDYMYENKILDIHERRHKVVYSILESLFKRSPQEKIHSERVAKICVLMGEAYGVAENQLSELRRLGELHDIGKIAISEKVLNQTSELSDHDWKSFMNHPEIGYRILSTSRDYFHIAELVLSHHERWDGTGYPKKLKGEETSWEARVLSLVESYVYMTTDQLDKKAMSIDEAIIDIQKHAGTQFDPELVSVFLNKVITKEK